MIIPLTRSEIGQILEIRRRYMRMSLESIASEFQVSVKAYRQIIRGQRDLSDRVLQFLDIRRTATGFAMRVMAKRTVKKQPSASSPERVLVLRTCDKNMQSSSRRLKNGEPVYDAPFQWPESGRVEAPDWDPSPKCGGGLHGLLRGQGDGSMLDWDRDAKWLAVWVDPKLCIDLVGKVKFPWCEVALVGDRKTVTDFLMAHGCTAVVGGTATAGDGGTSTAGDWGTAIAGYRGTAIAGDGGTSTAGDGGTSTAGYRGTSTAGDRGTAIAGYRGTAIAGDGGTSTAGDGGTATAGDRGILNIRYWDGQRYRIAVFYVGEDGIEPNVPYRVDNSGNPVKVVR